jgi:hypothetical protein
MLLAARCCSAGRYPMLFCWPLPYAVLLAISRNKERKKPVHSRYYRRLPAARLLTNRCCSVHARCCSFRDAFLEIFTNSRKQHNSIGRRQLHSESQQPARPATAVDLKSVEKITSPLRRPASGNDAQKQKKKIGSS